MDAYILEHEKEFFDLKDREKRQDDEVGAMHGVFQLDATPEKKALKEFKVASPKDDIDEDYMIAEVEHWTEKLDNVTDEFKLSLTNKDDTLNKMASLRARATARISDYARRLAKKNSQYKLHYAKNELDLMKGDKKLTKGTIETQLKALLWEKVEMLELMQNQINFFDQTLKTLDHIYYSMKYYKAMVDILSNTNPK